MNRSERNQERTPIRVVLLDPREGVADGVKKALAGGPVPFDIVHHTECEKALSEAESAAPPFQVAIVSNTLPGAGGLQACHRLQRSASGPIAVLMFELGQEDEASAALLAGVDEVLVRDDLGGYLKLLPGLLVVLLRRAEDSPPRVPEQLAVIIRSDPDSTEYQSAALTLRDSDPFWRALVESPFEYVLMVDRNGGIRYVNRILPGMDFRVAIGKKTMFDFVDPAMHEDLRSHLEGVFSNGKSVHFDTYAPMLDRWYANTAGPLYDQGSVIGVSVFARDITEQKKIEHRLQESEQRFRKLAESIEDVFYILDLKEMRTLYVSPAYETMYERPLKAVYDNPLDWMEVVHPDDREWVRADFEELARSRARNYEGGEYRILTSGGAIRWLKHRSFVIQETHGEPTQVAGVTTDVTAAKQAEDRLRKSEERYRTLISQASDGIALTDPTGRIVEVNDSVCEMLGYSASELVELSYLDVVSPEEFERDPPEIHGLRNGALIRKERLLTRKNGSVFPAEGSFKAMPDGRIQVILRDITERKKAEAELRRAHDEMERRANQRTRELRETIEAFQKAQRLASVGTLAAGIAHEINNPIGSILMAADSALHSLKTSKRTDEAIEAVVSIKNDARRAGQIVRTVLQLSRQESSHKWACDLGELARRARDVTRTAASLREVQIELIIDSGLPAVIGNPTEIEQVLVNVTNNAIEASRPGQSVSVRLTKMGGSVLVRVVDHGRGMSGEEVDRIFDPFYTTRQSEGGTGLGLSLTYSIIRQHSGKIDVESEPGVGTCISIRLPAATGAGTGGEQKAP